MILDVVQGRSFSCKAVVMCSPLFGREERCAALREREAGCSTVEVERWVAELARSRAATAQHDRLKRVGANLRRAAAVHGGI